MEAISMYALIEHQAWAQDHTDFKANILAVGNFGGIAKAIGDTVKKDYSGRELSNIGGDIVKPEEVEALALARKLTCINVNNDSQTVLTIVELPPKPKTRQYMVAQADTDDEGRNPSVSLFSDSDGNTNIYASAEEAREEIAKEVERIAQDEGIDHAEVSFGNPQFEDDPDKDFYTNVLKRMPAEAGETATVNLPGGSTRTFTIIDFLA
jgi:hypothetical protein